MHTVIVPETCKAIYGGLKDEYLDVNTRSSKNNNCTRIFNDSSFSLPSDLRLLQVQVIPLVLFRGLHHGSRGLQLVKLVLYIGCT